MNNVLRQERRREKILNGKMLNVVLMIAIPLVFYNLCNYLYGIFDMMLVQKSGIGDAADIVVLDQIKNMLSTIGASIAAGGGIITARLYGEGNIERSRKSANTLFTAALIVAIVTMIFIPLGKPLLVLLNTDQTTIDNAMGYYYVQILVLAVTTMNSAFIAIEKAKGNTKLLFGLNIMVIVLKISLTLFFIYGPFTNVTMTWVALATLLAQLSMFIVGMFLCFYKSNVLRITIKEFNLKKEFIVWILKLSIPIFVGRFLFSFGKVYVNSIALEKYGKMCVGALGISNTIAGLLSNIINSFEDGTSTIIAQNYGNKNGKRVRSAFINNLIVLVVISLVGTGGLIVLQDPIARFFAPDDPIYQEMINNIVKYERLDIIFMGVQGAATAVFYGFGKTKTTMAISMSTLFVFRIPSLLLMMYVLNVNYEACGIAMLFSNLMTGTIAIIIATIFIIHLPKSSRYAYLFEE